MNLLKLSSFFLLPLITIPLLCNAQTTDAQNQRNTSTSLPSTYFVDEAAVQLAQSAAPLDEFIDPETYILGPYDIIGIYGKGLIDFTARGITVSPTGTIAVPQLGVLPIGGLTLTEAQVIVQEAVNTVFKDIETTVQLEYLRPLTIHLGGTVAKPGKYIIPPGTRFDFLVNGLLVNESIVYPIEDPSSLTDEANIARFPTITGLNFDNLNRDQKTSATQTPADAGIFEQIRATYDMRNIEVVSKAGKHTVDLVSYFLSGNPAYNPYVNDGDQIKIAPKNSFSPQIGIGGAINQNFRGTYRTDDAMSKLIEMGGGFAENADTSRLIIFRNNEQLIASRDTPLLPNDQVIIPYLEEAQTGVVSLFGNVLLPGNYQVESGKTTLQDILRQAGGLTPEALPNGAYLIRNDQNIRGISTTRAPNLSLLTRTSDQFLEGFDYLELEEALNPNRMPLDLNNQNSLKTVLLDGDQIYIPTNEQLITIRGQVRSPGYFTFDPNTTVESYLNQAGGLSLAADKDRVFIIKAGSQAWYAPEETELASGDIIFIDRTPFENLTTGRNFEIQQQNLRNARVGLILSGVTTIVSVITAYVAITR